MPDVYDAQQAFSFLVQQATSIEAQVYRVQYASVQYQDLIPVDTSANPWTPSVTYFSVDGAGQAEWFHGHAKDVPLAETVRSMFTTGVKMGAIGYEYTLEELGVAQLLGQNLTADKAMYARMAAEQFIDRKALLGDPVANYSGLLDYPGIEIIPATGAWLAAGVLNVSNMMTDIGAALLDVYTESETVELADTMLVPIEILGTAASTPRSATSDTTVLEYILRANPLTALTGRPLLIRAIRGLRTAGVGGVARTILYRRSPDVLKMHVPMPFRFMAPWQTGPILFQVPGIMRLGGLDVRLPKAIRYIDGVMAAP